ncbi:MAG: hypothetical protein KJZ54_00805 [Phycisphaerales bacterium]|nr:hypothetical protein [Phycisphaerales bacterium]
MHHPLRCPGTTIRLLAAAAGLAVASSASAQNALGDGRALQQQQPGLGVRMGNVPLPTDTRSRAFERELAFREAIVTGMAPGGLSFRGDATPSRFEFRGELGSDDLFAFRRESLYSGLAGQGIRGTDALQYQFSLTTGQRPPSNLAGPLAVQRGGGRSDWDRQAVDSFRDPGRGDPGLMRVPQEPSPDGAQRPTTDLRVPPAWETSLSQSVRSTADFAANRGLQPTMLSVLTDNFTRESLGLSASPLTGVVMHRLGPAPHTVPGVPPEVFMPPPEVTEPGLLDIAGPTGALEPGRPESTFARTAYERAIERMARRAAADGRATATTPEGTPATPPWIVDLQQLRLELHFPEALRGPAPPDPAAVPAPLPGEETAPAIPDPLASIPGLPAPGVPAVQLRFDPATMRMIREAGGVSETFILANVDDRNLFFQHMRRGEELLAQGRFFDAEERFISALAARPGDVTALYGRLHAEIGGGMFLSAATNLRKLLFDSPEASALRWGGNLLPTRERIESLRTDLRERLDREGQPAADAALLLAYLGYQTGDDALLREAVERLERSRDVADGRLAAFLRGIWMGEIPDPAPIPEAPADPPADDEGDAPQEDDAG